MAARKHTLVIQPRQFMKVNWLRLTTEDVNEDPRRAELVERFADEVRL